MADRVYRTIDEDEMDLIAYKEYGVSSGVTELLLDYNYRIADNPTKMPPGIDVYLPPLDPQPRLRQIIHLWDDVE